VDLEVEVATGAGGVAGFADETERLALPEALAAVDGSRARQVGVEVAAVLAFAVDQGVIAIEDWVEAGPAHATVADRDKPRAAGGGDVEAFVDAAAVARRVELADRAAETVGTLDREDVAVVGKAADWAGGPGRGRRGEDGKKSESEESRVLQWCSITRSTMLYSFASSAVMK
jgi:hypothetical protein